MRGLSRTCSSTSGSEYEIASASMDMHICTALGTYDLFSLPLHTPTLSIMYLSQHQQHHRHYQSLIWRRRSSQYRPLLVD